MVHIPYKGGGPAIAAVVAGDAQLTFGTPPSVLPMVQAGRLKALAVTSPNRTTLVPNVPGTIEAGLPGYSLSFWYGFFVPVGTPPEVMKKLFEAAQTVMQQPEVKAALAREGTEVALSKSPPDGYTLLIASPSSVSVNPSLNPKLTYMKDLAPVTLLTSSPLVLAVNPGSDINSMQDLSTLAKAKPGSLNYTTSGNGSAPHLVWCCTLSDT